MRRVLPMILAGVFTATLLVANDVHALVPTLTPSSTDVRPGETITLTGNYCGTGSTITGATITTKTQYPKAPVMELPLNLANIGLSQTAGGFTFTHTPAEAEIVLWFSVTCSDTTTASSVDSKVTVWPPYGELWFYGAYPTPIFGDRGWYAFFSVYSIDCDPSVQATVLLQRRGRTVSSVKDSFEDLWMYVELPVPANTPGGEDYQIVVSCTGVRGGIITDSKAATIVPFDGLPVIGNGQHLWTWGGGALALGALLAAVGRRRRAT